MSELILHNATVVTLEPSYPVAQMVAVDGGRIQGIGTRDDLNMFTTPDTRIVDCGGGTLIPAFHDAHCHLLALAGSFLAVDCSPWVTNSIRGIEAHLHRAVQTTRAGKWIRARGYHEALLEEGRHPTRHDLDQAAPVNPVKLTHQSGHACVLNSQGLAAVGIGLQTPEPPGGIIDRDPETGEPTGLLFEMEDYLEQRIPVLTSEEIERGLLLASARLLSCGVVSVQDASHVNSLERWLFFQEAQRQGTIPLRVNLMPGIQHLDEFKEAGLDFGCAINNLRLGHAKIMLTWATGDVYPSLEQLESHIQEAISKGFPVAIHAVEMESVAAAVTAIGYASNRTGSSANLRHRIEHASECPPWLVHEINSQGILIATQPAFLFYNGRRYCQEVVEERQSWLYPLSSLIAAGVTVAGSSDAPVVPLDPMKGIYGAVTRCSSSKERINPAEMVTALDALKMYTLNAAYSEYRENTLGSITVGKEADMVLLDRNPLVVRPDDLTHVKVLMTMLHGQVVWQS